MVKTPYDLILCCIQPDFKGIVDFKKSKNEKVLPDFHPEMYINHTLRYNGNIVLKMYRKNINQSALLERIMESIDDMILDREDKRDSLNWHKIINPEKNNLNNNLGRLAYAVEVEEILVLKAPIQKEFELIKKGFLYDIVNIGFLSFNWNNYKNYLNFP